MNFVRHKLTLIISVAVVIAIALAIYFSRSPRWTESPSAADMVSRAGERIIVAPHAPLLKLLKTDAVQATHLAHGLVVPGLVTPEIQSEVIIRTPVTGRIIKAVYDQGQFIRKGDVLAVIASGDFNQAYANYLKAQAEEAYQERVVRRAKNVLKIGGNAAKDLDAAENALIQARAERERAKHHLESLGEGIDQAAKGRATIVSPLTGIIETTNLVEGENLTDVTATQAILIDLSIVEIEAHIPDEDAPLIVPGEPMTTRFDAIPGRVCHGFVRHVSPIIQEDSHRLLAWTTCKNDDFLLRPNMFANITIDVDQPHQILVAKSALLMNNEEITVFVEVAPRQFERRVVKISYDEGDRVRILSGLKSGDRVVTHGAILLNDAV